MTHIRLIDFNYVDWFSNYVPIVSGASLPNFDESSEYYLLQTYLGELNIYNSNGKVVSATKVSNSDRYYPNHRRLNPSVIYKLTKEEAQDLFGLIELSGL